MTLSASGRLTLKLLALLWLVAVPGPAVGQELEGVPHWIKEAVPDIFARLSTFDPNLANPCFRSKIDGSLKYAKLVNLRQAVSAARKEPFYWSERRLSFEEYLDTFKPCMQQTQQHPNAVTGEASTETFGVAPSTIWLNPEDPKESLLPLILKTIQPGLKPIVMLRDPVDRIYSAYWFFGCSNPQWVFPQDRIWTVTGPRSPEEFHRFVLDSLRPIRDCLARGQTLRDCYQILYYTSSYHILVGLYIAAVPDWLKVFTLNQDIIFLNFDVYRLNETASFLETVRFLDLEPPTAEHMQVIANIKANRGHDSNSNFPGCKTGRGAILPETRALLEDFYRPYNNELAEVLGDESYRWEPGHH